MPLSKEEMTSKAYVASISCPYCIDKTTPAQRARFSERARQIELAKQRGDAHIGAKPVREKNIEKKKKSSCE
jgi:UPF0176 protein